MLLYAPREGTESHTRLDSRYSAKPGRSRAIWRWSSKFPQAAEAHAWLTHLGTLAVSPIPPTRAMPNSPAARQGAHMLRKISGNGWPCLLDALPRYLVSSGTCAWLGLGPLSNFWISCYLGNSILVPNPHSRPKSIDHDRPTTTHSALSIPHPTTLLHRGHASLAQLPSFFSHLAHSKLASRQASSPGLRRPSSWLLLAPSESSGSRPS